MNYHKINTCDTINTLSGVAVSLFVSGCEFKCNGCFNSETWNFDSGKPFTFLEYAEICNALSNEYVTTFAILGGDPMAVKNRKDVLELVESIRILFPEKTIIMWTGYIYEDIEHEFVMEYLDYLMDGQYDKDTPTKKKHRGSDNQRLWKREKSVWKLID